MRVSKKFFILVGVAAIVALSVAWWRRSRDGGRLAFTTAVVKRGEVASTIGATGTIEPLEVVDVGAQVEGRISDFGKDKDGKQVNFGSTVEQGALLAKIDESVYAADLSVAKAGQLSAAANLEQMKAKLDQAAADWKRQEALFKSQLISQSDYDTSKANYEVCKANVAVADSGISQAQAALDKAQRNVDFCTINSPVSGVIIDCRVNVGQTVVASLNAPSLFLIARDLTKMQIWAAVNEADVGRIKAGTPVTFTVDAFPDREFEGVVGKIRLNATMTQNVVLYTVEINIDNPDKLLLPYLTANVHFVLHRENKALLVPNAALRWAPSSPAEIVPEARNVSLSDPPGDTKSESKNSHRTLWLKAGDFVRPVEVIAGTSDGANTAVTADALHESDEVVTGEIVATTADLKNPFLPKRVR